MKGTATRTTETLNSNDLLDRAITDTRPSLLIRNPLRVVVWVVDDLGALVRDTSSVQKDGSNNGEDGGLGASDGAVSSREHPLVADDDATAEVEVGGGSERRLVRELSKGGRLTSDDSSAQEDIRNGCATKSHLEHFFFSTKLRLLRDAETAATKATRRKAKRNILTEIIAGSLATYIADFLSRRELGGIHR